MSKHFCCCLPVRLLVFTLSLFTLFGSGAIAVGIWWLLVNGPQHGLIFEGAVKTGFIIAGAVWTVFALFALFGFVGAVIRHRALVRAYSFFLWAQCFVALALGVFFAVALFKESLRDTLINECTQRLSALQNTTLPLASAARQTQQEIQDGCSSIFNRSRVAFVVSLCVSVLINFYCAFVVGRYVTQLTEEQQYKGRNQTHAQNSNPQGYYPHTPMSQAQQGHYEYPYAQKPHSFGTTN